jgi:hypothetical protein
MTSECVTVKVIESFLSEWHVECSKAQEICKINFSYFRIENKDLLCSIIVTETKCSIAVYLFIYLLHSRDP